MLLEASMRLSDQPGKAGFDPARGEDGPSSIE
jgi:hypothetical protein